MVYVNIITSNILSVGYASLIIFLLYKYTKHRADAFYRHIAMYSLFVGIYCIGMILWYSLEYDIYNVILTFILIPVICIPSFTAYSIVAITWHGIYLKHTTITQCDPKICESVFNKAILFLNAISLGILYLLTLLIYFNVLDQDTMNSVPLAIRLYDLCLSYIVNGVLLVTGVRILKVIKCYYTEKPKKLIIYIYICIVLLSLRTLVSVLTIVEVKVMNDAYV